MNARHQQLRPENLSASGVRAILLETSDGTFTGFFTEKGLAGLLFPGETSSHPHPLSEDAAGNGSLPASILEAARLTKLALQQALSGQPIDRMPPLDLARGTNFQRKVWEALCGIPAGSTLAYGELAEQLGNPNACRAIGGACGANPIPVLVPCHRVLAGNGKLGGFTAGLDWKRKLLEREGLKIPNGINGRAPAAAGPRLG